MRLEEACQAIGLKVVYRLTYTGDGGKFCEEGVITSVNPFFVFVRYGGDAHSKATPPECLTLISDASTIAE